jgi:hypothetical protein
MYGGSCEEFPYYAATRKCKGAVVPLYRPAGICVPLIGWHNNGELEGKRRVIPEGIAEEDFYGGTDLMAQMARTLAENPILYNSIGGHDITPEHRATSGKLEKMLKGYTRDGLVHH